MIKYCNPILDTYQVLNFFTPNDIALISNLISKKILNKTGKSVSELRCYHLICSDQDHKKMADRESRVFSFDEVEVIKTTTGYKLLCEYFSGYEVSPVLDSGGVSDVRDEIYFRLVRPGSLDVGDPHCDNWFFDALNLNWVNGSTVKCWTPICIESGLNGLQYFPNSARQIKYSTFLDCENKPRPKLESSPEDLGAPKLFPVTVGQTVAFDDRFLHAGAPNNGSHTRVSFEITFLSKKNE